MEIVSKNIFILFFVSFFISGIASAQQHPDKKENTQLYTNIETYSKRSKLTKFMYTLVFKPIATVSSNKYAYKKLIKKRYGRFEGKTIRHINIETLNPFGYSISDTASGPHNFISKAGNVMHVKSQHITIRNLLLFRQGQRFDSLLVKESERLVRNRRYVRDVSFVFETISKNSDSVDIFIRELDNWSIVPNGSLSTSIFTVSLADKNFLGLGHEFQNDFTRYVTLGEIAFNTNYYIPNIRNTYINTTLHYNKDQLGNYVRSFSIDRPFFSPLAKWAAGVSLTQQFQKNYIHINDSLFFLQRFKYNVQDFWAGNAMQIFKGNTEYKRTTNFITALRFSRMRFLDKPEEKNDIKHQYSNENFYLASIGISTRKYVQDKYVFNFGVIEDVPIGKVHSITAGYQNRDIYNRTYLGARIATGYYYPWGYLSTNFEYGTFLRSSKVEQGVFSANVNYFTGLFSIGKWKFRQFVKPQIIIGTNRFSDDSLTLNDGYGLDGFKSMELTGTSRLLFTVQTQSYAPWNYLGFHIGPYLSYSAGMLGNASSGFRDKKLYSQIGFGILIKNEKLIFSTFQLSISFYPNIPGMGQNIFKPNSIKSTDFGFGDFEIGKPATVLYR